MNESRKLRQKRIPVKNPWLCREMGNVGGLISGAAWGGGPFTLWGLIILCSEEEAYRNSGLGERCVGFFPLFPLLPHPCQELLRAYWRPDTLYGLSDI